MLGHQPYEGSPDDQGSSSTMFKKCAAAAAIVGAKPVKTAPEADLGGGARLAVEPEKDLEA